MKKYDFIKCKHCGEPLNKIVYGNLASDSTIPLYSVLGGCCKTNYKFECSNRDCKKRYKENEVFYTLPGIFKPIRIGLKKGFQKGYDLKVKEGIKEIVSILENGKSYYEVAAKENENGIRTMGYLVYDERVQKLFRQIPEYSKDYNKKIEKVVSKEISKLSLNETIQYLTYIYRKERFCEGHIKNYIDNGILLQLLKHFLEVC